MFTKDYWNTIWGWYAKGGYEACLYFLLNRDLSGFSAKTAPQLTEAFHRIVEGQRTSEDKDIGTVVTNLDHPEALIWSMIIDEMSSDEILSDRENLDRYKKPATRKHLAGWLKGHGYEPELNPDAQNGRFKVGAKLATVYVNINKVAPADRLKAAREFVADPTGAKRKERANVVELRSKNPKLGDDF
jgi:hypothetical protein